MPPRVLCFESRRKTEMAMLLTKQGLTVTAVESMREVPLTEQSEAMAFGERLLLGQVDAVVAMTGVGLTKLLEALETKWPQAQVLEALATVKVHARGPKPVAVLRGWGLTPASVAKEPNTAKELLAAIDEAGGLAGQRVAVQEYGLINPELHAALAQRGAQVSSVSVYAWQLPEDVAPLEAALTQLSQGAFEAVVFTSGQQVRHVLEVGTRVAGEAPLRTALAAVVLASVGPTCTEVLTGAGLRVDVEPEHPKMGHLALALGRHFAQRTVAGTVKPTPGLMT